LSKSKKRPSGNPAPKSQREILAKKVFNRLQEGVALTRDLQDHITPFGDCLITLEQWTYLRGSVVSDLALLAELEGKPSPLDIIIKSEQQKVSIEF